MVPSALFCAHGVLMCVCMLLTHGRVAPHRAWHVLSWDCTSGEGSIFLLHGPPGVGKTLTAEAIAEMLHKPLYTVSMGELGTGPEALEANLQDVLALCVPWGALVLIVRARSNLPHAALHVPLPKSLTTSAPLTLSA